MLSPSRPLYVAVVETERRVPRADAGRAAKNARGSDLLSRCNSGSTRPADRGGIVRVLQRVSDNRGSRVFPKASEDHVDGGDASGSDLASIIAVRRRTVNPCKQVDKMKVGVCRSPCCLQLRVLVL